MNEIYTVAPDSATQTQTRRDKSDKPAHQAQVALLAPAQLDLPLNTIADAELVGHSCIGGWRGYSTLNHRLGVAGKMKEWRFPADRLPFVIDQAMRTMRGDHDLYIAQHSYKTAERSTAQLLSLNIGHIDLDVYKSSWAGQSVDAIVQALLKRLDQWEIPHPSYIVDSGRGLQAKWIWDAPIPPKALPRWQVAHRHLVSEILHDFEADPKAILPTQIMRLVGSKHQGCGREVSVCWVSSGNILEPVKHSFDAWCSAVLPWSREEVKEFRAKMAQYDVWRAQNEANLRALADDQVASQTRSKARKSGWEQVAKAIGVEPGKLMAMDDLVAGEIWSRRLAVMQRLQEVRGYIAGVPGGECHSWVWIAANAMGWVNRGQAVPLRKDVVAWAKQFVPAYSEKEAVEAASAVLRRANEQQGFGKGLYRMSEARFRAELQISESELEQLRVASKPVKKAVREGAMAFPAMKGLPYEAWKAETTSRRKAAGQYAARVRSTTKSEELRQKALELRSKGLTTRQIGAELGVSQKTASRWTSGS